MATGNADIVAVDSDDISRQVTILLGAGDGTFHSAATFDVAGFPQSVAVGGFNKDGKPDFVVANFAGTYLNVFLGNGDGTFSQPAALPFTATSNPSCGSP
jgi:hypothetical protein